MSITWEKKVTTTIEVTGSLLEFLEQHIVAARVFAKENCNIVTIDLYSEDNDRLCRERSLIISSSLIVDTGDETALLAELIELVKQGDFSEIDLLNN